jgi:xanthine/uracil permease
MLDSNQYDPFTSRLIVSGCGLFASALSWVMAEGVMKIVSILMGVAVAGFTIYYMREKDKREREKHTIFLLEHNMAHSKLKEMQSED